LEYAKRGDDAFDAGLNRFVWDMRYPLPSVIPGRAPTPIQPIAKPGDYQVKLTVDGKSQTRDFRLFMNPHEPYTQKQADERFAFWMDLYENVENISRNVSEAVRLRESVATRLQAFKDSGADASAIVAAEEKAAAVTALVDEYEGSFVAVGRTLAEIINLPAKVFTKMIWLHNMMEVTEGPVSQPMLDAYGRINSERDAADERYQESIQGALKAFESALPNDDK
jgi:hypothetical protein